MTSPQPIKPNTLWRTLFFPAAIVYLELILRAWTGDRFFGLGLLYLLFFSLGAGTLINLLITFLPQQARRVVYLVILIGLTILFGTQMVIHNIFRTYMELDALRVAGMVVGDFYQDAFRGIGMSMLPLLMLWLPFAFAKALGLWHEKPIPSEWIKWKILAAVTIHALVLMAVLFNAEGLMSPRAIYRERFAVPAAVREFGLVTAVRLDLQYTIFGRPAEDLEEIKDLATSMPETQEPIAAPTPVMTPDSGEVEPPEEEIVFGYNVLDIDFDALIESAPNDALREMHRYFAEFRPPTQQNEFTGMFEGKNLIWIIGEAFHTVAIHPEATPTLYRLSQEGFIFHHFFNPDTGFSTAGGEFMTLTGLIPPHRTALESTHRLYMPFAFGNMFRQLGYSTHAIHNHTHTFNGRHLSHPNLGYTWLAIGNGLEITNQWPRSDLEMVQETVDLFVHEDQFHVYYLTVSGHLLYTFTGNMVAYNNRSYVEDLPYSTGVRAFLATQMEFDRALAYLIDALDAAGRLEDTVIVISGDHEPYGLTDTEFEELSHRPLQNTVFDRYHSSLIIWNAAMEEPIHVGKYASSLDVLPTLANLFGLPFDSRLFAGADILSDAPSLIPFASGAWISQYGRFNPHSRQFTPHPWVDEDAIPLNHAVQIDAQLTLARHYSGQILVFDYFRILFYHHAY